VIQKQIRVQSVNGPGSTLIQGYQVPDALNGDEAVRCVYMRGGAALTGFMLTQGATRQDVFSTQGESDCGGGVYCFSGIPTISNCVVVGNAASRGGGGSCYGLLINCQLLSNTVPTGGGRGSSGSSLRSCFVAYNSAELGGGVGGGAADNCTVVGNMANWGGGISGGVASNCTIKDNWAATGGGGAERSTLTRCVLVGNSGGIDSCGAVRGHR
jgi:hypothetical protein